MNVRQAVQPAGVSHDGFNADSGVSTLRTFTFGGEWKNTMKIAQHKCAMRVSLGIYLL